MKPRFNGHTCFKQLLLTILTRRDIERERKREKRERKRERRERGRERERKEEPRKNVGYLKCVHTQGSGYSIAAKCTGK